MAQRQVRVDRRKATAASRSDRQEPEAQGPRPEVRKDVQRVWWPEQT